VGQRWQRLRRGLGLRESGADKRGLGCQRRGRGGRARTGWLRGALGCCGEGGVLGWVPRVWAAHGIRPGKRGRGGGDGLGCWVLGREWEKEAGRAGLFLGLGWVAIWVLGWFGFFFFFSLSYFKHHSNLFEFKSNLNSTPMHSNKIKPCTSMNAQTYLS